MGDLRPRYSVATIRCITRLVILGRYIDDRRYGVTIHQIGAAFPDFYPEADVMRSSGNRMLYADLDLLMEIATFVRLENGVIVAARYAHIAAVYRDSNQERGSL